jgi:hypothetical protein
MDYYFVLKLIGNVIAGCGIVFGGYRIYCVWEKTQTAITEYYRLLLVNEKDIHAMVRKNKVIRDDMERLESEMARRTQEINDLAIRIRAALTL